MPRKQYPSDERKAVNEQISNLRLTDDFWKNVPIVDATKMICLFPKRIDLENAEPGNPENCVYARCVKRVLPNARRVRIWRNVALIETKDSHGRTIAERYIVSTKGKKALMQLDQGVGEIQPCSLFAPTVSTSLAGKRKRDANLSPEKKAQKSVREKQRRLQQSAGTYKPVTSTKHQGDLFIRNGSGHMTAFKEDAEN
jgi:hypothetical protein